MSDKNTYDAYDMVDKEFVIDHATQGEIKEFFQDNRISCKSMSDRRSIYRERYLITPSDIDPRDWILADGSIDRKELPSLKNLSDIWAEWQEAVDKFKNVEWVKHWEPGVRVLGR